MRSALAKRLARAAGLGPEDQEEPHPHRHGIAKGEGRGRVSDEKFAGVRAKEADTESRRGAVHVHEYEDGSAALHTPVGSLRMRRGSTRGDPSAPPSSRPDREPRSRILGEAGAAMGVSVRGRQHGARAAAEVRRPGRYHYEDGTEEVVPPRRRGPRPLPAGLRRTGG
jgi:hypothetical protein